MANAIVFDDKTRSAEITYQELIKTDTLADHRGNLPASCPIEGGELIERIAGSIQKFTQLEPLVKPIIIREPYCTTSRHAARQGRDFELSDYQINRFVTKFELPVVAFEGLPEMTMRPGIAITYCNQKGNATGIQIAFGENVEVCDNLTAFGKFRFSTYGGSKVSFDEGFQLLHHWLQNFGQIHEAHIATVKRLSELTIDRSLFYQLLGHLFEKAVRVNSGDKIYAPLNQTQIAAMVKQGMDKLKEEDKLLTGWDVMNWGTDILKPQHSDMVTLLQDTTNFNDFVMDTFEIPTPEFDI